MRTAIWTLVGLLGAVTVAVPAAPPFPGATTFTVASTEGPIPIPDGDAAISLLNVDGAPGIVFDLDVAIDLQHPAAANQLSVQLISPSGTLVAVETNNGGNATNVFTTTVFDDQAPGTPSAANVRNKQFQSNVSAGVLQPEQALAALRGEPAGGPWLLVVRDNGGGGQPATLRGWSLTITAVPAMSPRPGAPVAFPGPAINITDNRPAGVTSAVTVSGVGVRLWDVDVSVSITHNRASDLDLYLTAPNGQRIDLVTAFGGNAANLYRPATFDDQSGVPMGDLPNPLPNPLGRVAGEGALGAFTGIDPNGTWTLTVADHTAGTTGKLDAWTLTITTTTVCGDGALDPDEVCDDGNSVSGDGCDANCTPTACGNGAVGPGEDCDDGNTVDGDACPATCHIPEAACDNCLDDDGDGLADAADAGCGTIEIRLKKGSFSTRGGGLDQLTLLGTLASPSPPAGTVAVVLGGGGKTVACGAVGDVTKKRRGARGSLAGGQVTVSLSGRKRDRVTIKGRRLDLSGLVDGSDLAVGLRVGDAQFSGRAALRTRRGRKAL